MNPIQQAIEAIEACMVAMDYIHEKTGYSNASAELAGDEALTSLRSLQKEVEGVEPVGWRHKQYGHIQWRSYDMTPEVCDRYTNSGQWDLLYTADQLRTAVAAALGREADVKPDLFCTCGNEWQWNTDAGAWELVASFIPDEVPEATQPTQAAVQVPQEWRAAIQSAIDELPYRHHLIPRLTQLLAAQPQGAPTFTTDDPDLDNLLNTAHWMREQGTTMDVGLVFSDALERVKKRLATQPTQAEAPSERDGKLMMALAVIRELTGTQHSEDIEDTINAVRAALATQQAVQVEPQGWVQVPVEPTPEMLDAAEGVVQIGVIDPSHVDDRVVIDEQWRIAEADGTHVYAVQGRRTGPARIYRAMLDAAPKAVQQAVQGEPVTLVRGVPVHGLLPEDRTPMEAIVDAAYAHAAKLRTATPPATGQVEREPMTDAQIEKLREATFSTNNPFCPVDSKSMRKAVRAAEFFHDIKEPQR